MATGTLGTNANNSLTSLKFLKGYGSGQPASAWAAMNIIKNDLVNGNPLIPFSFTDNGLLYVPNRGVLKVFEGDYVGVDNQGWPILVSKNSIANGNWTHTN